MPANNQPPRASAGATSTVPSDTLYQQALYLHGNGHVNEAIQVLTDLIARDRRYCPALNLLSILHQQQGDHEEGLRIAARSLKVDARQPLALNCRGLALRSLGRVEEALASFERAIELKSDYSTAWCNRGLTLQDLKRNTQALTSYDRALALKPDSLIAHFNRAMVLRELKRHAESLTSFDRVITLDPAHFEAHSGRAMALHDLHRNEEALLSCDRMIAIRPNDSRSHRERGLVLQSLHRYPEALHCCESVIDLAPNDAQAWCNRGIVLWRLGRCEEALFSYDRAIHLAPDLADAHFDQGLLLLLQGDLERGWPLYEWRWKSSKQPAQARNFAQPLWLGEALTPAATILLHAEQGYGDTVQFCRYAPMVLALGFKVILQAPAPLLPLLQSLDPRLHLIPLEAPLPAFDWQCPLLSLPLAFRTSLRTIPAHARYLHVDAGKLDQWKARLGPARKPRIGIAWSGSVANKGNAQRSIRFAQLQSLLDDDYEWHAVQKDIRADDLHALTATGRIRTHTEALLDFADTAALIAAMDLVISVDSAPAHVAGALGKPVWILLPHFPDFRWLLDRTDSPWYPTATLIRQAVEGDWQGALQQASLKLREYFGQPGPQATSDARRQHPVAVPEITSPEIDALYQQAVLWQSQGRRAESIRILQALLDIDGRHVAALALLSILHQQSGDVAAGLQLAERALHQDDRHVLALNARGLALRALNRPEEALGSFDRLTALHPGYSAGWCNRAMTLQELLRCEEALSNYDRAIEFKPDNVTALHNKALLALLLGRYREGWPLYESRWRSTRKAEFRNFQQPLWLGDSSVEGKTLLLHAEQGFGDSLQFCRYVPLVAALGARVVVEAPAPLLPILATLDGTISLIPSGDALPAFDLHCPLMSLPLAFHTEVETIPAQTPYLRVDDARRMQWRKRLGPAVIPRIGICWSGSAHHLADASRSLALQTLQALLRPDFEWHVVQKDIRESDRTLLERLPQLRSHAEALSDFADTAALIDAMDLVITVDTASAHLAGALGKPVWVLLPFCPDFRWLLERADSPWYPSARLFRQQVRGDWTTVINQVGEHLATLFPMADGLSQTLPIGKSPVAEPGVDYAGANDGLQQALQLHGAERIAEASALLNHLLKEYPDFYPALNLLSIIELQNGKLAEGLQLIEQSLRCNPLQAEAHNNRGLALRQQGDLNGALASFDLAIMHNPGDARAFSNRGVILQELGRCEESLASHERALALQPGDAPSYANRGVLLQALGRFEEAMHSFDRALSLDARLADAWFDKSLLCLLLGRFDEGWKLYEWRWQSELRSEYQPIPKPLWLGEPDLRRKTILLHHEQGLGDGLQFCRYVPMVAKRAARVILVVPPSLVELMKTLPASCEIHTGGDLLPDFDLHCPLMSLPLAFKTTLDSVPSPIPYLRSQPLKQSHWRRKLGARVRPRIGLAWSGSTLNSRDATRSLTLQSLQPLLQLDIDWHVIQKDIREQDRTALSAHPKLIEHQGELGDFTDTAALVDALDLVISIDSSPAHLAGALGKPVWILLPQVPDFRWLLDRDDSPWYPGARLFRQQRKGDWEPVVKAVIEALEERYPEVAESRNASD